jgi:hypothetical protein
MSYGCSCPALPGETDRGRGCEPAPVMSVRPAIVPAGGLGVYA